MNELFTIGYTGLSLDVFLNMLKKYGISVVADVRSIPYSSFQPTYNKDNLECSLREHGMIYVFLGDSLGARINDQACYLDGRADYHLIASHPKFREGLGRIRVGVDKYRIALMCAERDPITCHRAILICRNLRGSIAQITHILSDGTLEDHQKSEERLLALYARNKLDFFKTEQQFLEEAYDYQGKKIAYQLKEPDSNGG